MYGAYQQWLRIVTFETFDQNNKKTWSDQQKYNDNDKDKYKYEYKLNEEGNDKHNNNRDLAIKSNTVDSIRNSCDVLWGSFGQMFTFCEKLPIILLAFALCKMRRHFIFEIEMTLVHAVTQPWGSREQNTLKVGGTMTNLLAPFGSGMKAIS